MGTVSRILGTVWLLGTAALTMGNQKCESNATIVKPKERVLRRSVEIREFKVRNMQMPEGREFDFASVTSWQLQTLTNETERFIVRLDQPQVPEQGRFSGISAKSSALLGQRSIADIDGESYWQKQSALKANQGLATNALAQKTGDDFDDPYWPSCLRAKPHLILEGQINSFVLTSQGGAQIGYGTGGILLPGPGFGLNFQTRSASMDMGLRALDATWGWLLASGQATSRDTETRFNMNLNLGLLSADANYFHKTPLSMVTQNGITKTLNRLTADMEAMEKRYKLPKWEGRVLPASRLGGTHVLFNGGRLHGIRTGDTFYIHNVVTLWEGEICKSKLIRRELSREPSAIVVIEEGYGHLGENYAWGRIIQQNEPAIRAGASVLIKELIAETKTKTP
jgi:hypothetical protein